MDLVQYSHGVLVAQEDVSNVVAAPQPSYNPLPEQMPENPYAATDADPTDKTLVATKTVGGDDLPTVGNVATIPPGADPTDPTGVQANNPDEKTEEQKAAEQQEANEQQEPHAE